MAIKGITDQGAGFLQIGKLFKGDKKQKKSGQNGEYEIFGKELDYWRFESDIPIIKEAFDKAFPGEPRELPVYLPFATRDENWQTCKEAYTAGAMQHRCDGETCSVWLDVKTGTYKTTPIPCPTLTMTEAERKKNGCSNIGRLKVFIPALGELGFVTMETHSINDIARLDTWLAGYASMSSTGLRNIPFSLYRYEEAISTPRDGKRVRTNKWLVGLKPDSSWSQKYLTAQHQQMLAQSFTPLALAAGNPLIEDDDESDEVHEGVVEHTDAPTVEEKPFDFAKATAAFKKGENILKTQFKITPNQLHDRLAAKLQGVVPDLAKMTAEELAICIAEMRSWYEELDKAKENK